MARAFEFFIAIVAVGLILGSGTPTVAAEMSPETAKLFDAVSVNNFPAVKRSLLDGADIRVENFSGRTAIDLAIDKGYFAIAHYLLAWRKQRSVAKARLALPPEAPDTQEAEKAEGLTGTKQESETPEIKPEPAPIQAAVPEPAPIQTAKLQPAPVQETPPEPAPVQSAAPEPAPEAAIVEEKEKGGFFDKITNFFTPEPETLKDQEAGTAERRTGNEQQEAGTGEALKVEAEKAAALKAEAERAEALKAEAERAETEKAEALKVEAERAEAAKAEEVAAAQEAEKGPGILSSITDFFSFAEKEQQEASGEAAKFEAERAEAERAEAERAEAEKAEALKAAAERAEAEKAEALKAAAERQEARKAEGLTGTKTQEAEKTEPPVTILGRISEFLQPASRPSPPPAKPLAEYKERQIAAVPSASAMAMDTNPFLTKEMSLGKNQPKKSDHPCIDKKSSQSLFCIEPVQWPRGTQGIGASFEAYTTLYRGQQVIVHYEKGRATQFHSLFPRKNFGAIVDYFTKQFGPPSEKPEYRAAVIGAADRKNRSVRWLGPKPAQGRTAILEVREIDDLRWSAPPDLRFGAVWLYFQGTDPVFRYVSWSDFLLARVRRQGE